MEQSTSQLRRVQTSRRHRLGRSLERGVHGSVHETRLERRRNQIRHLTVGFVRERPRSGLFRYTERSDIGDTDVSSEVSRILIQIYRGIFLVINLKYTLLCTGYSEV